MAETFAREYDAMQRALQLAASPGVPLGPNPRVGCVVLAEDGSVVGEGYHRGAGTPHAEIEALKVAGTLAGGATAVVTLEPCDHTGRTGPCSQALVEAGVRRVVIAQRDPNPLAKGGLETLAAAGIETDVGLLADDAAALNRAWTFAHERGRPFVTWKFATTLDGRSAATDGSSRWVSSPAARRDTHLLRALCDTILVGTNTVAVDDPQLTVRDADGEPLARQPLRAVMGERDLDPRRAGSSTIRRRPCSCGRMTRSQHSRPCTATMPGTTSSSRVVPSSQQRSSRQVSSTRCWSTSRRC